uniref:DUF1618 domain-containing protein n=1 Tax=Leersia perrieri TaxID=77586 RepID=A0A0D9VB65_9ORYZ
MMRRFVNLVVDSGGERAAAAAYKLYRVAASSIFSSPRPPPRPPRRLDQLDLSDERRRPATSSGYHPSSLLGPGNVDFIPIGSHGDGGDDTSLRMLAFDIDGRALLYGAGAAAAAGVSLRHIPDPCKPKVAPIPFLTGDGRLFLIETAPFCGNPSCFEVLSYGNQPLDGGHGSVLSFSRNFSGWYWRTLPPPPFAKLGYDDVIGGGIRRRDYDIVASAQAPDDSELWITAHGAGTFKFNTKTCEWRKLGDWAMPFHGRGEFIDFRSLWLGLSTGNTWRAYPGLHLCLSDLGCMDSGGYSTPPPTFCLLDGLDRLPNRSSFVMQAYLVHLGYGRICIARFIQEEEDKYGGFNNPFSQNNSSSSRYLLLTGVEMLRDYSTVVHTSRRYNFHNGDFIHGTALVAGAVTTLRSTVIWIQLSSGTGAGGQGCTCHQPTLD